MKIRLFTFPNLLTLMNLFFGCLAIVFILQLGDLKMAFWFMIIAAIFDFCDGFSARLLNQPSEVGKQLDSLSDVVSFGVVPAVFLYVLYDKMGGTEWWSYGVYVPFILAMFSSLRLAKFNIDEEQTEEFVGLNTPACAILVGSVAYLYADGAVTFEPYWILVATVVLSWLLISPIRMFSFKFKSFGFKENALRYLFLVGTVLGVIIWKMAAVPFVIVGYVVVSIVRDLAQPKKAN